MFKKLIISGAVASLLATGAMANDYMNDIYASIGSQGSYEFGLAMDHKDNLSSKISYKNIADKELYKGTLFSIHRADALYWGLGIGLIHSKADSTTTNRETKPTINGVITGEMPYLGAGKIEGYLADAHNLGAAIELNVWNGQTLFNDKFGSRNNTGGVPFVTVGAGADKIQGETEKSVFVKLHYTF